mmetsp:Transcript_90657/g.194408  ORF Transcript_90657/g.194408 Transcript_90657/m.194408 type:complete len:565 (+) Transcript_90657:73-1767(+)
MARGSLHLQAALIAVGCLLAAQGKSDALDNDAQLRVKVEELRRLAVMQQERIEVLKAEAKELAQFDINASSKQARRLTAAELTPSIFAPVFNSTRAYTTAENETTALTHQWIILCGALVMFMQAGFAMVECGACRAKNVQNILLKNITDVCVGTLGWWAFGFCFAYGGDTHDSGDKEGQLKQGGFIGAGYAFGNGMLTTDEEGKQEPSGQMLSWFFQWAFCSAASTIVSGGVAERANFAGYSLYSFAMTAFIYPVVVAWGWGYGWLTFMNDVGISDFAGSGIVHMTGGVGALVGAIIAGPRKGRFDPIQGNYDPFAPHSVPLIVLGTFILWFGWYGFNCGSTLAMTGIEDGMRAAQVAMNTTLAAACGGLVTFGVQYYVQHRYDVPSFCNGILGGLVSITAGCNNVECGSACLIGMFGGLFVALASAILKKCKVDDPIDAFAVHGCCGAWGVMAAFIFDMGKGLYQVNGAGGGFRCIMAEAGPTGGGTGCRGQNYPIGQLQFLANLTEVLVILLWVGGLSAMIFAPLKMMNLLRVDDETQDAGLDQRKHSPSKAYYIEETGWLD